MGPVAGKISNRGLLQGLTVVVGLPFWSQDSRYIVFETTAGKLQKIEAAGGPPLPLCDVSNLLLGGFWTSDNKIVFAIGNSGLQQVPVGGGKAAPFINLDASRGDASHEFPSLLPDGRHFIYLRYSSQPENGGIYLGSSTASPRSAVERDCSPTFPQPHSRPRPIRHSATSYLCVSRSDRRRIRARL